jgi:hypothetical protein
MSRRPAIITQADVARVLRAAKQTGAGAVEIILPDGTTIQIDMRAENPVAPTQKGVAPEAEIAL